MPNQVRDYIAQQLAGQGPAPADPEDENYIEPEDADDGDGSGFQGTEWHPDGSVTVHRGRPAPEPPSGITPSQQHIYGQIREQPDMLPRRSDLPPTIDDGETVTRPITLQDLHELRGQERADYERRFVERGE